MAADTPTPGDSGAPLNLDGIRAVLARTHDHDRGWARAYRDDVGALLAEIDRLTAERTTHLLGVGHPMWLPSVADTVDHPDPFNATPSEVFGRGRRVACRARP